LAITLRPPRYVRLYCSAAETNLDNRSAPREVRDGAPLKAITGPLAADGLLADARHHLRDVDGRALGAAGGHGERGVAAVQRAHAHLARRVAHLVQHALHAMLHHSESGVKLPCSTHVQMACLRHVKPRVGCSLCIAACALQHIQECRTHCKRCRGGMRCTDQLGVRVMWHHTQSERQH
jgi:hypothetical protein